MISFSAKGCTLHRLMFSLTTHLLFSTEWIEIKCATLTAASQRFSPLSFTFAKK